MTEFASTKIWTKEFVFPSWKTAQKRFDWRLKRPAVVPDFFELTALQSFHPMPLNTGGSDDLRLSLLTATYSGPKGSYFSFEQFELPIWEAPPLQPRDVEQATNAKRGSLMINEVTGYWVEKTLTGESIRKPDTRREMTLMWRQPGLGFHLFGEGIQLPTLASISRSLKDL